MIVSVGTLHVTAAFSALLSTTCVVSVTMLIVTLPEAGAFACTETSGVVSVAVSGTPVFPGLNGPGCPNFSWFGAGSDALSAVVVPTTCHCAGLVAGSWFRLPVTSDL